MGKGCEFQPPAISWVPVPGVGGLEPSVHGQRGLQEQEHLQRSPSSARIHPGDRQKRLCSAHRELVELQRGWMLSRSHQPQLWSSSPFLEPSE